MLLMVYESCVFEVDFDEDVFIGVMGSDIRFVDDGVVMNGCLFSRLKS
jgi:hypothetical protein